ncbi:MAG: hypothetical protein KKH41_02340 [Candidatus Thermoplasmatota archaeon]|nr:hypothetical protein [Euryarchaeota archaeon]MBU4070591.1 hypothetical protein [Candidatus Thermoplasmatota archaeon]MBU4143765.1 hypothetical protein [Candidatus Thermoplasmatota archaeon]MBU4591401.1 hypothetical protein [Candidatus Thermoplasmatota archaeon]
MASLHPFSPVVIRKAFPALVLILFIFVSLLFLIRYTGAFYLVILLWIVIPVMFVKAHGRLKDFLARKK